MISDLSEALANVREPVDEAEYRPGASVGTAARGVPRHLCGQAVRV